MPIAPFVRTVTGDVPADALGWCHAHEHLIIDPGFATHLEPEFLLDSVDAAVAEVQSLHAVGVRALVDAMPAACGRSPLKLAEVAQRTSVHIVCPTGVHLRRYYPPGHWVDRVTVDDLAALFVADIEEGVDVNDYNGPEVARTGVRAGVIKVASSAPGLSDLELRHFAAAAHAHRATGCPILTHTSDGEGAHEQCDVLEAQGVDLGHVVLSHLDRAPNVDLHRSLLQRGVCLEYDSAFRWPAGSNPTRELFVALAPTFPGQILLGMDAARRRYWHAYGGSPGLVFLATTFCDELRAAGVDAATLRAAFVDGPARAYAFATR